MATDIFDLDDWRSDVAEERVASLLRDEGGKFERDGERVQITFPNGVIRVHMVPNTGVIPRRLVLKVAKMAHIASRRFWASGAA